MFGTNCGFKEDQDARYCFNCGVPKVLTDEPSGVSANYNVATHQQYGGHAYPYGYAHSAHPPYGRVKKPNNWGLITAIILGSIVLIVGFALYMMWFFGVGLFGASYGSGGLPREMEERTEESVERSFARLVRDMDRNNRDVPLSRVIELFGDVYSEYEENELGKTFFVFAPTESIRIRVSSMHTSDGRVSTIRIIQSPDMWFDETLVIDEAYLIDFIKNSDTLNLVDLEMVIGASGRVKYYDSSARMFGYEWISHDAVVSVYVNRHRYVRTALIKGDEITEIRLNRAPAIRDTIHAGYSIISAEELQEVFDNVATLAFEMDAGDRHVRKERISELFGSDYKTNEYDFGIVTDRDTLDFVICSEIIFQAVECPSCGRYSRIFLYAPAQVFFDEDLVIDGAALRAYNDSLPTILREERPPLAYFENMLKGPGVITSYFAGEFSYIWVSSDYIVELRVDRGAVDHIYVWENTEHSPNFDANLSTHELIGKWEFVSFEDHDFIWYVYIIEFLPDGTFEWLRPLYNNEMVGRSDFNIIDEGRFSVIDEWDGSYFEFTYSIVGNMLTIIDENNNRATFIRFMEDGPSVPIDFCHLVGLWENEPTGYLAIFDNSEYIEAIFIYEDFIEITKLTMLAQGVFRLSLDYVSWVITYNFDGGTLILTSPYGDDVYFTRTDSISEETGMRILTSDGVIIGYEIIE